MVISYTCCLHLNDYFNYVFGGTNYTYLFIYSFIDLRMKTWFTKIGYVIIHDSSMNNNSNTQYVIWNIVKLN